MGCLNSVCSDAKDNILFGAPYDETRYKKGAIFLILDLRLDLIRRSYLPVCTRA